MPFPLLAALPAILGIGGKVASGIAGGSAQNRQAQDQANLTRDQLRLLAQRDFRDSQNDAYTNAMRSSRAQNWKHVAPPGGIPDAYEGRDTIAPGMRQAAQAMERRALLELMTGRPMQVSQAQRSGKLEKILGPLGLGLGVAGAIGGMMPRRAPQAAPDLSQQASMTDPNVWSNIRF